MTLLAINIPTYERLDSFSSILLELENEFNSLQKTYKDMLQINVFDNNSLCMEVKKKLCKEIALRSDIDINFKANETNIGADRNIQNCCRSSLDAKFTWVLGDDDHLAPGCLPKILLYLIKYSDDIGLFILSDDSYQFNASFKDTLITSYEQFARQAIKVQPHLLIAHTLISTNIFRTSLYDPGEADYVLNELTPRAGLIANFVHMRGMVKGLLKKANNKYAVLIPNFTSLDTSKRLPSDNNFDVQISKIYYFYYLWILMELGVSIDQVPRHQAMWWLFEGPDRSV